MKEEKFYFDNDLAEYRNSLEGLAVKEAFKSGDTTLIEQALKHYYYCRNVINQFTYASDNDLKAFQKQDRDMATLLHELD